MADRKPSTPVPKREPARDTDGLLAPLAATALLLGIVLVWARTYEQSCLALASPGLLYIAIFWGLLEYRLERRRFAIDYYLDSTSPWRRLLRGSLLSVATCMVAAIPLAVFLAGFAALSHTADWLFLAGASVLAPVLFNRLSVWPGRHFRRAAGGEIGAAPNVILTTRLAGRLLLALLIIAYVYFNYFSIVAPDNISPGVPGFTASTFAAQVRSACPVVQTGLQAAATFDGAAWSIVTGEAMARRTPNEIMMIVWAALFLNAALAMTGFVRGLEGAILLTRRVAPGPGTRAAGARSIGVATIPKRWAVGIRWAAFLLIPLSLLAAIGHHALQQRAAERWSAEFRQAGAPEMRQFIDESVETAFTPAYAVIPEIVDRHHSIAGIFDALTPFIGEDKRLVAELRRQVSASRGTAALEIYQELHKTGVAQLARLFSRDVEALPPWLHNAYEWVLQPVLERAKSRFADALGEDPRGILSAIERPAEPADFATRAGTVMRGVGHLLRTWGTEREKEVFRQWATAVVDGEKEHTKAQLSRAVETVMFTPLGDFVPSRLRPPSQ